MAIDPESYKEPIFFCQGEALVREIVGGEVYQLLEAIPSCGLEVGDNIPKEWGLLPANKAARMLMEQDQFGPDDF